MELSHLGYWFGLSSLVVTLLVIGLMPKHLSRKEVYLIWVTMIAVVLFLDTTFAVALDLYDFVEPKVTITDLVLQATLPPSFGVIFTNFIPKRTRHFIIYLCLVTLFSLFFEWLCTQTGYIVYKGWKLYWSTPFYFFGLVYLRWHLSYVTRDKEL
jgi:hypothetical protein